MAEDARVPLAIRIARPFATEEEFLRLELDCLTRTTVTLAGAQSRPQGIILRFEVTLSGGEPLLRGEGRVVGSRPAAEGQDSGLTLRFTRLDARSKALVDRAAALREARARSSMHPPPRESVPASAPQGGPAPGPRSLPVSLPPPPPLPRPQSLPVGAQRVPAAPQAVEGGVAVDPRLQVLPANDRRSAPASRVTPGSLPAQSPAERSELLDRLRRRAKALSPSAVEALLASRKRPAAPG